MIIFLKVTIGALGLKVEILLVSKMFMGGHTQILQPSGLTQKICFFMVFKCNYDTK